MKKKSLIMATFIALALVLALAGGAWAGGQASITLLNSDAVLGNFNDTAWTLAKDTAFPNISNIGTATWEVTAAKGATTHNFLTVNGYMEVNNTGSAPATIGNIVVNLQKQTVLKGKASWISAAADVADASSGDGATTANIVASASPENKSFFDETPWCLRQAGIHRCRSQHRLLSGAAKVHCPRRDRQPPVYGHL